MSKRRKNCVVLTSTPFLKIFEINIQSKLSATTCPLSFLPEAKKLSWLGPGTSCYSWRPCKRGLQALIDIQEQGVTPKNCLWFQSSPSWCWRRHTRSIDSAEKRLQRSLKLLLTRFSFDQDGKNYILTRLKNLQNRLSTVRPFFQLSLDLILDPARSL